MSVKLSVAQVDTTFVDHKYFEDQLYFAINYNGLLNHPENFFTNTLSGGILMGYMRDIPLNKRRNVGFGIGIGYAIKNYRQNLKISESNGLSVFEVIPYDEFETNKLILQLIEMPIQFRWRTSTATKYSFWRIYTGIKLGYIVGSKSQFSGPTESFKINDVEALERLQYGLSISFGYGSLNANFYYGLNNLFKEGSKTITGEVLDLSQINIGLIFYML